MTDSLGLRVVPTGSGRTDNVHTSCGRCSACAAGRDFWCTAPTADGRLIVSIDADVDAEMALRWVSLLAAFADSGTRPADVVLVLADAPRAHVEALVALWHSGVVRASSDGRDADTRTALAGVSATGRAHVVLAARDGRRAVKSVQRGGTVCLPAAAIDAPTITELVQRDVRLVGPNSVAGIVDAIDVPTLGRCLRAVLGHTQQQEGRS